MDSLAGPVKSTQEVNMHVSAIEDAAALVPWIEPNAAALVDPELEAAVLLAFSGPVPPEYANGVPLLRFAYTDIEAMPLLDAITDPPKHAATECDRCGDTNRSVNDTLWVPSGASVVVVHLCWQCKACVFERTGKPSSLVWS